MEDEKWQDNFASERTDRSREGYKPFDSEKTIKVRTAQCAKVV